MHNYRLFAFADEASPMLNSQIDAMQRNQLNGLEIRTVDNENVSDITLGKAREIRKRMDDAGLLVWSIGSPIGKIDIDTDDFDAHLDKYRHTLDIAGELGAQNIRLFSFYIPEEKNPDEYENKVLDRMAMFDEIAAKTAIRLCHENEKGIYGDIASRCVKIHKALPRISAVFDPANFVQSEQDTLQAWELLKEHVAYLHIKDSMTNGNVVPAGKGDGNVADIVRMYLSAGGNAMTLEPHLAVFTGLDKLERKDRLSGVANTYTFESNDAAFDAACAALRDILSNIG